MSVWKADSGGAIGMAFGPDDQLYVCQNGKRRIVRYSPDGTEKILAEGVPSNDLAVSSKGAIYFTDPENKRVWHLDRTGHKRVVTGEIEFPNGIRFSADQSFLFIDDTKGKYVWSFQVSEDGSLQNGSPFFRLETEDFSSATGADGMAVDSDGFLYVATSLGLQVCDQPGRVEAVIRKPQRGHFSGVVFGGADFKILYATAGDKVFRRPVRRQGASAWAPVKPPVPQL